MENLKLLLQENLNQEFLAAVLSAPRDKSGVEKVKVRPLLKRGNLFFNWSLSAIVRRFMRILVPRRRRIEFLNICKI